MRRLLRRSVILLVVLVLAAGWLQRDQLVPSADHLGQNVAQIVDGDTVDLADGTTVRLLGIDTPEVYGGIECGGREASARLAELLPPGTPVTVEAHGTDRYGRVLAWLFLADGRNVSEVMVAAGMGPVYRTGDGGYADAAGSPHLDDVLEAEAAAQAAGAGWWSQCRG